MLGLHSRFRFYLYKEATDMRKSFDGLCGLVEQGMKSDPLSGDVYIFINRRRDRMKLLVWEGSGFWIYYKRLESGAFQLPPSFGEGSCLALAYPELMLILEGIDLGSIRRRRRYFPQKVLGRRG